MSTLVRPGRRDAELETLCDGPQVLLPRRSAEMVAEPRRLADAVGPGLPGPVELPLTQWQTL